MRENYKECLTAVLKYEGGYSNHPRDPGGATMKGITQGTYNAWRKKQGLATRPVKQIEQSEIEAIYKSGYWNVVRGDELPSGLDLAVFDYAVNSGPGRALRHLQSVLGVPQTGAMNKATLDAAQKNPGAWAELCDKRLNFMKNLDTWSTFGAGWSARVADVRRNSARLAAKAPKATATNIDARAAQKRLSELNYPLGKIDGVVGYQTQSAIRDFQSAMGEPITGELDPRTYDILMSDSAERRPVSSERQALTVNDLKSSGSKIINGTEMIKSNVTTASAALAAASGVASQVQDVAGQVQSVKDAVNTGAEGLSVVWQNWQLVAIGILLIVAVICVYQCWRAASNIEAERLRQARSGENLRV